MAYKTILFEERDSLAIVHLNRPDKLNAFNQQMLHDLLDVLDTVDKKDNIKALIITGSGKPSVQELIYLQAKKPSSMSSII